MRMFKAGSDEGVHVRDTKWVLFWKGKGCKWCSGRLSLLPGIKPAAFDTL